MDQGQVEVPPGGRVGVEFRWIGDPRKLRELASLTTNDPLCPAILFLVEGDASADGPFQATVRVVAASHPGRWPEPEGTPGMRP